MCVDLHINKPFSVKRKLNIFTTNVNPGQPAHCAQVDLGRNPLLLVSFLRITLSQTNQCLQYKFSGNTVRKGEIGHNEQFLLFPVFSTFTKNFLPHLSNLKLSSARSFCLEESKFCYLGKGKKDNTMIELAVKTENRMILAITYQRPSEGHASFSICIWFKPKQSQ